MSVYDVVKNDSLWKIVKNLLEDNGLDTSNAVIASRVKELKTINNLGANGTIYPGQSLKLWEMENNNLPKPAAPSQPPAQTPTESSPSDKQDIYHTTVRGDNVWNIAKNFAKKIGADTSNTAIANRVEELKRINHLNKDGDIAIGQRLKLSGTETSAIPHDPYKKESVLKNEFSPIVDLKYKNPPIPARYHNLNPERFIEGNPHGDNGYGISNQAIMTAVQATLRGEKVEFDPRFKSSRPIVFTVAGHGSGADKGAPSVIKGVMERDVVSPIAKDIAQQSYEAGFNAVVIGNPDRQFPIPYMDNKAHISFRGALAHNIAALTGAPYSTVLAIEANATPDRSSRMSGTRLYTYTDTESDATSRPALNADSDAMSHALADHVQVGHNNTKIKTARFAATGGFERLRHESGIPGSAVLVETGYVTNRSDTEYLLEHPDVFSKQVVEALADHVKNDKQIALSPHNNRPFYAGLPSGPSLSEGPG